MQQGSSNDQSKCFNFFFSLQNTSWCTALFRSFVHWGTNINQKAIRYWAKPSFNLRLSQQEQCDTSEVQQADGRVRTHAIFLYARWRGWSQRKRSKEATVTVEDTLPKPLNVSQVQHSCNGTLRRTCWAADEWEVEDLCTASRTKTRICNSRPREDYIPSEW